MKEQSGEEEENPVTEAFENYADEVRGYRQKMREVVDVLEEYAHNVERFKQGELDEEDMLKEIDYVSGQLVELDIKEIGMRSRNPGFEPEKGVVSQLTEAELTPLKLEEDDSIDVEARDLSMGGLTSIEDRLTVVSEYVVEELTGYESGLLQEELDTSLEEEYSDLLEEVEDRIYGGSGYSDEFTDILENPRDSHSPYILDEGTESLEDARQDVRSKGPRHPLSDKHEVEELDERDLVYIH